MKHLAWACCLLLPFTATAGTFKSKGEVTAESRAFSDDDNDQTQDTGLAMFARIETRYRKDGWRLNIRGFGRVDNKDSSRDLTAIEEAWFGYRKKGWDVRLGYQMLNWTATEAFHPADVVNSRNLDSNIENPEKLGEMMLSVRKRIRDGGLTFYYMPRIEDPELPGSSSRLSFLPDGATYTDPLWLTDSDEAADGEYEPQWGARFTQTIGDADLSVHYLDHLDRQQPLAIVQPGETGLNVTPVYFRVKDYGLTYLHVLGGLIFKLEAAHKDFVEHDGSVISSSFIDAPIQHLDHTQIAFGLEYGLAHVKGSETTFLFEGQTIEGVDEVERASLSIFQRDLLVGVRHAFNDTMGREILATAIVDAERNHEYLLNLSYTQRLSDTWSIDVGARYIDAPQKETLAQGLELLDESNQIYLNISRFF